MQNYKMSNIATINRKLKKIEKRIEDNVKKAWYENGLLLLEIQQGKLYKEKHSSFESYLKDRWDYEKKSGYRLIDAAKTYQILEKKVSQSDELGHSFLPKNESQIRPLMMLENDSQRVHIWNELVEADIKITRASVTEAVNNFKDNPIEVEFIEAEITDLIGVKGEDGKFHISSKENDWYTPSKYIDSAREVLNGIDLDPASSELAQKTVKATIYHTEETNGLDKEWSGSVWMNPPYSMPEIQQFVDKLIDEGVDEWVVLTNNSSDTGWFHKLLNNADVVCFTRGRVGFENIKGDKMATRQGQAFFYKGNNTAGFEKEFKRYGAIL